MKHPFITLATTLLLTLSMTSCGFVPLPGQSSTDEVRNPYDGVYSYKGFQLSHIVHISGDTWTSTVNWYGDLDYDSGVVKDGNLYDSSGYFVIATINGSTINWGNKYRMQKEY